MDQLLEAIRAATKPDATEEAKAAGATACRTILSALEAKAGEPLASAIAVPPAGTAAQLGLMVNALRGLPPEQLLDLAISRLKAALPPGTDVQPTQPVKFQLVPITPRRSS